jgi:hypothetical protein
MCVVPENTIEKLEEEAKADIAKELEKVREKLTFYEGIAESPEYEEASIVRKKGARRKPYRAFATTLAQELGVPVPKSAKTLGMTWKEIYQQLLKEKEKNK